MKTAAVPTAAAHFGLGATAAAASTNDATDILPYGAWWTPPGARCTRTDACPRMLHWWQGDEHGDGEGAAVVATTRRSSAAAVLLLFYLRLFCLVVRYSCGMVGHDLAMRGATAVIQAAGETTSWILARQRNQTKVGGSDQHQ